MAKIATIKRLWNNNKRDLIIPIYNKFVKFGIFNFLSDEAFIKLTFWIRFGKKIDLSHPQTFNEKLNWLKLHDRQAIYSLMVDKYEAKRIVADKIGTQYIVKTYGVYECFSDIPFDDLPDQFVVKCTHDSGSVVVCRKRDKETISRMNRIIKKGLRRNLFYWAREWPYKYVKPRIIVEEYISSVEKALIVYKVFCFHGHARIIQVIQNDKLEDETIDYYDTEWNLMNLQQDYPNSINHIPKPKCLYEMILLSEKFIPDRAFLRVDWYIVNNRPLFSEFTFFSDAGFAKFVPETWDKELGSYMRIASEE